jgi:hypothetical protein
MDYFSHPGISNTKLGWYEQSPAHFQYFSKHGTEPRESYLVGNASHTVLFEPETFQGRFYIFDPNKRPEKDKNFNSTKNKAWKKEIQETYSSRLIVTKEEYDEVNYMMEALKKCSHAQELLSNCIFEEEVYWTDPTTGLSCKKKVDFRSKDNLYRGDYKTTDNADPHIWQKKAWRMDYFRQAGHYSLSDPIESPIPFYFIAQEKTPPYAVSVHKCTQDMIDYGKNRCNFLLNGIKTCMVENFWPSYEVKTPSYSDSDCFDFDIPHWVIRDL